MARNSSDERRMVERILQGARKGGRNSQAHRSPAERKRIGRMGGRVVQEAFKHYGHSKRRASSKAKETPSESLTPQ